MRKLVVSLFVLAMASAAIAAAASGRPAITRKPSTPMYCGLTQA